MNLPNKLTVFRIVLIPVFLVLLINFNMLTLAGIVFMVASLTDLLDGKIARKNNLVTNFGKFADPLADKMLVCAALVGLCSMGMLGTSHALGIWATFLIISREFIVTGIRLLAAADGTVIAAAPSGKIKTTVQMITIIYILFSNVFTALGLSYNLSGIISNILVVASLVLTIYSGAEYVVANRKLIDTTK